MGSFFVMRYLAVSGGAEADGAVLLGTGSPPRLLIEAACRIAQREIRKRGGDADDTVLQKLALRAFNRPFERRLTNYQWLSRVTEENRKFEADPLCRFFFSNASLYELFTVMRKLERHEDFERISGELPVLILSGTEDPVGEKGAGAVRLYSELGRLGFKNVEMKLYPGARHELLHEQNREEVFSDIRKWTLARTSERNK